VIAASGLTALTMAATLLQEERFLLVADALWSPRSEAVYGHPISVQAASSYYRGLIADGLGETERAVTELLHSIEVHRRLRAPLFLAASQAALAEMTADRHLAAEAMATAERFGAWGIVRQARSPLI
jgi:hypothetical protein